MFKFGLRDHRGGLQESLATTVYISEEEFRKYSVNYEYYGYDDRVHQFKFIRKEHWLHLEDKVWLFIEVY